MSQRDIPTKRQIFEAAFSGNQDPPLISRLRSDPGPEHRPLPQNLREFRDQEGRETREQRLRGIWSRLPARNPRVDASAQASTSTDDYASLTPEKAERLQRMYENELLARCGHAQTASRPSWKEFKAYAEAKEAELWFIFHDELDLDGNGHLDAEELALALSKAGITIAPSTLSEFMAFLTSSVHSHGINFREFRDFLLLLPRKISTTEIYDYYKVKKFLGDDGRGAARVTMEGDVSLSAEDRPPDPGTQEARFQGSVQLVVDDEDELEHEEKKHHDWLVGHTALKYLLAGGIAGTVSRTCTAPFDRLKVFLITRRQDAAITSGPGLKATQGAAVRIYAEGGLLAFWVGNGLAVAKIFPESAIKFYSYESSKRLFAKYWDGVQDVRDISGFSRFVSGGLGGIASQLSIYPVETLKTQIMSTSGERQTLINAARHLWTLGGVRAYYRGLGIGLLGVFPYSAIDMSTFDALKLAYLRSTGKEEPGVLDLLAFGSISGSVGATSVYPLNLVRTRLQASGSSGHPTRYTGVWDVVAKTLERDGWRGFYRGLLPTLGKVVPSVSITYVVYESSKRRLGV